MIEDICTVDAEDAHSGWQLACFPPRSCFCYQATHLSSARPPTQTDAQPTPLDPLGPPIGGRSPPWSITDGPTLRHTPVGLRVQQPPVVVLLFPVFTRPRDAEESQPSPPPPPWVTWSPEKRHKRRFHPRKSNYLLSLSTFRSHCVPNYTVWCLYMCLFISSFLFCLCFVLFPQKLNDV